MRLESFVIEELICWRFWRGVRGVRGTRAFLALAARWERVERWNILGGFGGVGLVWFDVVRLGVLWDCGRWRGLVCVDKWWFG